MVGVPDFRTHTAKSAGPGSGLRFAGLSSAMPVDSPLVKRRLPLGAEVVPSGGVHFRVWAPRSSTAAIEFEPLGSGRTVPLRPEGDGYYSGIARDARLGDRYKVRLERGAFPDPASRFQPEGPHGPSEIVAAQFAWTDSAWRGRPPREWVFYELHLGTFTAAGTWRAAIAELPRLHQLGVTVLEIMPIADFAGTFGWGYDGVNLFAPTRLYGRPEEARAFIDRAHQLGLMVILDVVYNHLGPDGNYLWEFSQDYFSTRHRSEWGENLNFDDHHSGPVREFFITNARYWIEEFHFDGLRFDASQQITDSSPRHIIAEITAAARAAGGDRLLCIVAENEPQDATLLQPSIDGGCGLDALWSDDFHHAARVAAAGRAEAYISDYRGVAQEFVSIAKHGFLYAGQWSLWQQHRRGSPPFAFEPWRFILYLQNHDQVANSLRGSRLHQLTSPAKFRALTALLLLLPQTPLLFQGQEFAASSPFTYFSDHRPELQQIVTRGRQDFLRQFPTIACDECGDVLTDPADRDAFARVKLKPEELHAHDWAVRLHADLLRRRRDDPTLAEPVALDGAVLSRDAFVLRYFSVDHHDRLLIVNLGSDLRYEPAPEPLLAPAFNCGWRVAWSSEAPAYGGGGTPPLETVHGWFIPGQTAVLLSPDVNPEPSLRKIHAKA